MCGETETRVRGGPALKRRKPQALNRRWRDYRQGWCSRTCVARAESPGFIWGNTLTLGDFGVYAGHIPGKTRETLKNPALPGDSASEYSFSRGPKRSKGASTPSTQLRKGLPTGGADSDPGQERPEAKHRARGEPGPPDTQPLPGPFRTPQDGPQSHGPRHALRER